MRFGLRELIFILLLLGMPVAAYLFIFQPRNAQLAEARREIQAKQAKLAQLEAATRSIDDLGREIDRLSEAIQTFNQKLPAEREVEVILKEVWELAARHELQPKSVRTEKESITSSYSERPIRLAITGDFDGFYSFLLDLEKLRRITRTPQMKLTKVTREQDGQMQADMVLTIYFDAQGDAAGAGKDRL